MTNSPQSVLMFSIVPIWAFVHAQLITHIRNWRSTAPTLFTPLLLLVLFTLTGEQDGQSMVPFVVGFTVMFSGQTLAQVLVSWRVNRVFTRLAATPTPTGHLLLATVLTHVIIFVMQAILVMVIGLLLSDLQVSPVNVPMIFVILTLSCMAFLSFGATIAAFVQKVETAGVVYTFVLLPMIFMGAGILEIPGVSNIGHLLPTALVTVSLDPYFGLGDIQTMQSAMSMALLLIYTGVFTLIAARFFKTSA